MTEMVHVDVLDDGLIWALNEYVMHPRGYALGYDPATRSFCLLGDGSTPWGFDPEMSEITERAEKAFADLVGGSL